MNCPKCGTINNENAKFCGGCGNDLSLIQTNMQKEQTVEQLEGVNTIQEQNNVIIPEPPIPPSGSEYNQQTNVSNNNHNKNSKKLIIIIVLAVIIIAIVAIIVFMPTKEKSEKQKLNTIFDEDKLIRITSNDKYGYIDTNGKMVIPAQYGYASEFESNYAVVVATIQKENEVLKVYQLIDQKGKVKLQSENEIEYLSEKNLWLIDEALYNESLKKITDDDVRVEEEDDYFIWVNSKKNTGGIMNSKGKITYTYNFSEGENYISINPSTVDDDMKDEVYCIVNIENKKYGIVNCNDGTIVYDYTEQYISDERDNVFEINDRNNSYKRIEILFANKNKIVYQSTSSTVDISHYSGDNYVTISDSAKPYSEKYSYIDLKTSKISKEKPEIEEEEESKDEWEQLTGYKKFNCSTGYGLIKDEKIVIPCELHRIEYLDVPVYKYLSSKGKQYIYGFGENDIIYIIDIKTNKKVTELKGKNIIQYEDSTFIKFDSPDYKNEIVYNLLTGKYLSFSDTDNYIEVYSNHYVVKNYKDKTRNYYNADAKLIYSEKI